MADPTHLDAVDLLRRAESYLSALHGSVARHDNLGANLACAGCALRGQIHDALNPKPAVPPEHVGSRVNAEDCPACCAATTPPPYPFICPGETAEPDTPVAAEAAHGRGLALHRNRLRRPPRRQPGGAAVTTPADDLRAAAALLRDLADAASTDQSGRPTARWTVRYRPGSTPGSPPQTGRSCYLDAIDEADTEGRGARPLLHGGGGGTRPRPPSVEPQHGRYIAAMHPAVGAALADWLNAGARAHDAAVKGAAGIWPDAHETAERDAWIAGQTDRPALAVARAILTPSGEGL
ncbi:hypothetical protein ACIOEX_01355 [Streptomyces sp. NPDC087850]|uniref:hypothetical protein n=1 Tax=Streptomyces sp. NPDC087850 TaxID=3365809 RepID=UPI0037F514C5